MKIDDFLSKEIPGQMTVDEVIEEIEKQAVASQQEEQSVTSGTPDGIAVYYSWHPKRLYRLGIYDPNHPLEAQNVEWTEVPSVTAVLGVLDKSGALTYWGMKVGVAGLLELLLAIDRGDDVPELTTYKRLGADDPAVADVVEWLRVNRLTVNHQRDKAADRGTAVHAALETWCGDPTFRPNPENYEENEQGYIRGLVAFLDDLGDVEDIEAEVMVGSIAHGYAGRYDLRLTIPTLREVVVKTYPKRKPKVEEIPDGKWLLDLKTSKDCYSTHSLQLAAYEAASIECGYGPTDYRAVVRVSDDGRYELRRANATAEDFLSILQAHTTMQKKNWFR